MCLNSLTLLGFRFIPEVQGPKLVLIQLPFEDIIFIKVGNVKLEFNIPFHWPFPVTKRCSDLERDEDFVPCWGCFVWQEIAEMSRWPHEKRSFRPETGAPSRYRSAAIALVGESRRLTKRKPKVTQEDFANFETLPSVSRKIPRNLRNPVVWARSSVLLYKYATSARPLRSYSMQRLHVWHCGCIGPIFSWTTSIWVVS